MKTTHRTSVSKNSIFPAIAFAGVALASLAFFIPAKRQYSPGDSIKQLAKDGDGDKDANGMAQFFYNARMDNNIGGMNYQAMLAADYQERVLSMSTRKRHSTMNLMDALSWSSLGPTATGGRTRAILIDNRDATHQTIFACGVSGGIWKSTNGGSTWGSTMAMLSYSQNDTLSNMNTCCIAQDPNGIMYVGTGEGFSLYSQAEGFSTGILGGGIFKSTDDGTTWTILPSTIPTPDNDGVEWAYTNRIAVQPNNPNVLYAAQLGGLEISTDGGNTWNFAKNSISNANLTGSALDVKISGDGSVIVACVNGKGYYCYPNSGDSWQDNGFTPIPTTGAGKLPTGFRLEFAISPTDPNRIYVSEISNSTGGLGSWDVKSGIYMTETAKTNGGYWYLIGPGGSMMFDPYTSGGTQDQCDYDNAIAVFPTNEGSILIGGTTIWQWQQANSADTIGEWKSLTTYGGWFGDPLYVHPDQQAIVFDLNNPAVCYFGCDGGIYKSFNINSYNWTTYSQTFAPYNRNYDVTQNYAIAFSPEPANNEGVIGGTQDNGTPYISGNSFPNYRDGIDYSGGDGGGANISKLNPEIAFVDIDYGTWLGRTGNLATSGPTNFYNQTKGQNLGGNIDSVARLQTGCFVFPQALYENDHDTLNADSMLWIAPTYESIDTIIYPLSNNGPLSFPYKLPRALNAGDTIKIPNRVVSKLAIGFSASNGIWITAQAIDQADNTIWMPVAGPKSKPTACTGGAVHCIAWTPDGDHLFFGTEDSKFFRLDNLNTIVGNNYRTGGLWSQKPEPGGKIIYDSISKVKCYGITLPSAGGRDILSVSVDPLNRNRVIVTYGNYGNSVYVVYSNDALSATPTFVSKQGNLPPMPVYGSLIDVKNGISQGVWATNAVMLATEHGVWSTDDITATSPVWTKNSNGMSNTMTLAIKQQTRDPWNCINSGQIYVGSHGRGIWSSSTINQPLSVPPIASDKASFRGLTIYPNPMNTQGTVEFNLSGNENLLLTVYDVTGKEVYTQQLGTLNIGQHLVPLNVDGLNSGAYFVSLVGTNYKQVGKFIVQN